MRPWASRVRADQDLAAGTQNNRIKGGLHPPLPPAAGTRHPVTEKVTFSNPEGTVHLLTWAASCPTYLT